MVETINKTKLTSPGMLLIMAVACAGGIFLLDQFSLAPYLERQEASAHRERAVRAETAVRAAVDVRRQGLREACVAWARHDAVRRIAGGEGDMAAFAGEAFGEGGPDLAWITAANGEVVCAWARDGEPAAARKAAAQAVASLGDLNGAGDSGLLKYDNTIAAVARQDIPGGSGQFWLGRRLDATVRESIGTTIGGELIAVVAAQLPRGMAGDLSGSQALWSSDSDTLAVAWWIQDMVGNRLGYFRADVPVAHVRRQAAAARRAILIVLALSVGLCLLVIVGTHILVSGPVIRLLRRIQRMEAVGGGKVDGLTRQLHGEPLVLARRLESAFERLASMSKTDQLTGLANRGHFEKVLEAFYYQARRYNRPMSLVMMDIDFFKAINDAGGHQAGDELLKQVANCIETACRKADLPARLGGDEFAILLPETPAANAAEVAERIRREVAAQHVECNGVGANVTMSIGITDLNSGAIDSPDAMMSLADQAMYAAKEEGRNCLFQAHDLETSGPANRLNQTGEVDVLSKKLIGLDTQFKDMFVQGLEEIMEILAHRDPHMAAHARKTQRYAVLLANEMGLPDRVIKRLRVAGMLHDIGMLAMPDSILLCDSGLDGDQVSAMRKHPLLSVRIMEGMEFLEQEIPTVRYHHERFDGSGYPEGLKGGAIPLTARILTVADAFDAMTSPRTFRSAKSIAEAIDELRRGSGTQFDPAVVEAFVTVAGKLGEDLLRVPPPTRREPRRPRLREADMAEAAPAENA